MTPMAHTPRHQAPRNPAAWQLLLADLALILFLVTLSALPASEAKSGRKLADSAATEKDVRGGGLTEIAASQALFRPVAGGPSLTEWLAGQPRDPRATLTVFVRHRPGGEAAAWQIAQRLADDALRSGVAVRTIITPRAQDEIYASLAYDTEIVAAL